MNIFKVYRCKVHTLHIEAKEATFGTLAWMVGHSQRDPSDKIQQEAIKMVISCFSIRLLNGHWQWGIVTGKNWLHVSLTFTFASRWFCSLKGYCPYIWTYVHTVHAVHNGLPWGTLKVKQKDGLGLCLLVNDYRVEKINTFPPQGWSFQEIFARLTTFLLSHLLSLSIL